MIITHLARWGLTLGDSEVGSEVEPYEAWSLAASKTAISKWLKADAPFTMHNFKHNIVQTNEPFKFSPL